MRGRRPLRSPPARWGRPSSSAFTARPVGAPASFDVRRPPGGNAATDVGAWGPGARSTPAAGGPGARNVVAFFSQLRSNVGVRPLTFAALATYAFAGCTVTHYSYDNPTPVAQGSAVPPGPTAVPPPTATGGQAGACGPNDCGPRPGAPNHLCADGVTTAGPTGRCLARSDGLGCAWELIECPAGPPPRPPAAAGQVCGTRGAAPCAEGLYCRFSESAACGEADRPGACEAKPTRCPREDSPVCGCDGKTYASACSAHAQGVSVKQRQACGGTAGPPPPSGQVCGTRGAQPCTGGTFCAWPESAHCGATDRPGVCMTRPSVCTRELKPVCGCDGKTYPNACAAHTATISIDHAGPCSPGAGR